LHARTLVLIHHGDKAKDEFARHWPQLPVVDQQVRAGAIYDLELSRVGEMRLFVERLLAITGLNDILKSVGARTRVQLW
jgi:hypothetical protein